MTQLYQQKRFLGLLALTTLLTGIVVSSSLEVVHAAAGDLDRSFDGDGRSIYLSPTTSDRGLAAAIQPDGKIIVVGDTDLFGTADALVLRFNANGSVDRTFDNDGRRVYLEPRAEDHGQAVAVQANGKIVVAGYSNRFGTNDALLLRFNSNGALDSTFDRDGRRIFVSNGDQRIQAVAIQASDGKIVAAGRTNLFGRDNILVLRFHADGRLDTSLAGDGSLVLSRAANDIVQAVALQPDKKIIVAGYTNAFGDNDFAITRFNENGSLDTTFANGGRQIIRNPGKDDRAQALVRQGDGKIIVAGYTNTLGNNDFAVMRLNANGSLDSSFHSNGQVIISGFGRDDRAQALALQGDGKIIVAGYTNVFGNNDFAVARLRKDGNLDASFGGTGRVITRGFGGDDRAFAAAVSPIGGKIIVAGYSDGTGAKNVAVACYLP